MMNKLIGASVKTLLLSGLLLVVFSCTKDLEQAQVELDQTVSKTEVRTILDIDTFSSAADGIVTAIFQQGESGKSAKNEDCYTTTFTDTGYTVNFDNCSAEEGGPILNGMLTVRYVEGDEPVTFTATYTDLSVDGIIINGTRGFTMNDTGESENVTFTIVSEMSITLADGSIIGEAGTKTFTISFDITNFTNSSLAIAGNWTVTSDGDTYIVNVSSELVAYFGCDYVGTGLMALAKNGLEVIIDFGDGTCDDMASISYPDGTTEDISLKD